MSDSNSGIPAGMVTESSYFPRSHRSSTSSASTDQPEVARPAQPSRNTTTSSTSSQATPNAVDPLSREYPKPVAEIDVAEALARAPRKWTLAHWAKNAKEAQPLSKELQSKKFEDTKKELLKAKMEMSSLKFNKK